MQFSKAKDNTSKQPGLFVPMPIPEQCSDVWSMDFISSPPSCQGYNTIYTYINNFTKFVWLIPCFKGKGALSAPEYANLFFSHIVRLFGVPKVALHNYDSRFTSRFWKALWELLGTKLLFYKYLPSVDGQIG